MYTITIEQVREIKEITNTCNNNREEWKRKIKLKARELGIKDSEMIELLRKIYNIPKTVKLY